MFESLGNSPANNPKRPIERCLAGKMLSPESSKSLEEIILEDKFIPIPAFIQQITDLMNSLPNQSDQIRAATLFQSCINDLNQFNQLRFMTPDRFGTSLKYDFYLNFSKNIHGLIDTIERCFLKDLKDHSTTYGKDNEEREDNNRYNLLKTCIARLSLNFFFADEEQCHSTNISSMLSFLPSDDGIQFSKDFYTTISPHLVRAITLAILRQKQKFLNEATTNFINRSSVKSVYSALRDKQFKKTTLAGTILPPVLIMNQDGYNINLTWEVPTALSLFVRKNLNKFESSLTRIKQLLKDVDGDLTTRFDDESSSDHEYVIVTIHCPVQDEPLYDPNRLISDEDIFISSTGKLPFLTQYEIPTLELKRDYDKANPDSKLKLHVIPNCITTHKARHELAATLYLVQKIDTHNSIEMMSVPNDEKFGMAAAIKYRTRYIDGTDQDTSGGATLIVNTTAINKQNTQNLRDIIQLAQCEEIRLLGTKDEVGSQLENIGEALLKASEFGQEPFTLKYSYPDFNPEDGSNFSPVLEIRDCSGYLVMKARYLAEERRLAGRLHKPELTIRAMTAFEEVFSVDTLMTKEPYLDTNDAFFIESLTERFEEHNIYLTDSFKALVHTLAISENCHNIHALRATLQSYICNGIMSIYEDNDALILDAPEPFEAGQNIYYENNII